MQVICVVAEFADWDTQLGKLNQNMEGEEVVEAAWES